MCEQRYPKVLILGYFNLDKPVGITTNNMFSKWPKSRLAIASFTEFENLNTFITNSYYILGKKEIKYIFPLNLLFKTIFPSRMVEIDTNNSYEKSKSSKSFHKKRFMIIKHILERLFRLTGLSLVKYKYQLSFEFLNWLNSVKPDIIYFHIEDISRMKFILAIMKSYKCKYVMHIMDDWVHSPRYNRICNNFWQKRKMTNFIKILNNTDLNIAICEKMADVYMKRYKKKFVYIHNPVDVDFWHNKYLQISSIKKSTFNFVYMGKLTVDTLPTIKLFISALEKNSFSKDINLSIYSTIRKEEAVNLLSDKNIKYFKGRVNYSELPKILSQADGLLLPASFKKKSIRYAQLSMPTKVTEYMSSGTPVFYIGPIELAVYSFLKKANAAYLCKSTNDINECIEEFISNTQLRSFYSRNAIQEVENNHTIENIHEKISKYFLNL